MISVLIEVLLAEEIIIMRVVGVLAATAIGLLSWF